MQTFQAVTPVDGYFEGVPSGSFPIRASKTHDAFEIPTKAVQTFSPRHDSVSRVSSRGAIFEVQTTRLTPNKDPRQAQGNIYRVATQ